MGSPGPLLLVHAAGELGGGRFFFGGGDVEFGNSYHEKRSERAPLIRSVYWIEVICFMGGGDGGVRPTFSFSHIKEVYENENHYPVGLGQALVAIKPAKRT